jgi:hypothetical protein
MNQLEMFKNVRRNDSDTSFAAAASMETAAKRYKAIVYRDTAALRAHDIRRNCEPLRTGSPTGLAACQRLAPRQDDPRHGRAKKEQQWPQSCRVGRDQGDFI